MSFVWFLLIGVVAGWLAGKLVKGSGFGVMGDLFLGVVGSVLGGFVLDLANVHAGGLVGRLLTATLGAVLLLFAVRFWKHGTIT